MPFDLKELERLGSQDVPYEHSMALPRYRDPEVEDPAFDIDELVKLGRSDMGRRTALPDYEPDIDIAELVRIGSTPDAQEVPEERSAIGEIGAAIGAGWHGTNEMVARAGRVLGYDTDDIIRGTKVAGEEYAQTKSGAFWGALHGGVQSTVQSILGGAPAALAGGAVGGPAGAVLGFAGGAGTLFSLAEYDQFLEEAEEMGIPREAVQDEAIISALAEGGIEAATDLIGAKIFGLASKKIISEPIKQGLLRALANFSGRTAKGIGKLSSVEVPGEMVTSAIQASERQKAGIPTASPGEAAMQAIGPASVQTVIMGGLGGGAQATRPGQVAPGQEGPTETPAQEEPVDIIDVSEKVRIGAQRAREKAFGVETPVQEGPVDILEPKTRTPRQAIRIGDQPPPSVFDELAQQENLEAEEELRRQSEAEAQAARFDREPPGTYSREAKATLVAARDFLTTNPNMPFRAKVSLQRQIDDAAGGDPDALYGLWEQIASERGVEKPAEAMDPEYRERQRQEREAAKARVAGVDEAAQGEPQRATIEGERGVSPAQTGPSVVPQMPGMEQRAAEVDLAAVEAEKLRTGERVSEIDKPVGNSVLANPKLFGDSSNAKALLTKGFELVGRNRQKMILSNVKSALNNPEVFRAVVEAVPVNVMNDLIGEQLAPNDLLHNKSMLTSRLSVPSDVSVPQPVISFIDSLSGFLKERLASGATKKPILPSPDIPASSGEQSAAVVASKKADGGKAPSSILPHVVFSEADSQKLEVNTTPTEAQTQEKEKVRPRTKAQVEAEKPEVEILEGYPVDKLAETEVEVKAIDEKGDVYAVAERADKAIRDIDEQTETYYSILECVG